MKTIWFLVSLVIGLLLLGIAGLLVMGQAESSIGFLEGFDFADIVGEDH